MLRMAADSCLALYSLLTIRRLEQPIFVDHAQTQSTPLPYHMKLDHSATNTYTRCRLSDKQCRQQSAAQKPQRCIHCRLVVQLLGWHGCIYIAIHMSQLTASCPHNCVLCSFPEPHQALSADRWCMSILSGYYVAAVNSPMMATVHYLALLISDY